MTPAQHIITGPISGAVFVPARAQGPPVIYLGVAHDLTQS